MTAVLNPPEQRVLLRGVSWETYERLLAENQECSNTRFTYDRGRLEIMVLSAKHEAIRHAIALLVEVMAEELAVDVYGLGSTTFRREDLERGFEPDACFYIRHESLIRGKDEIDLTIDPPPDLVIEVDITHPSLSKFPLLAAFGVPEVWRHDGKRMTIFTLDGEAYIETATSRVLPPLTSAVVADFIDKSKSLKRTAWLRLLRDWAQRQ